MVQLIGGKRDDRVRFPRDKVVVIGFYERAGGNMQVRFGIGEYIEEEIAGRKEESFRVRWEDGRVDVFPVPSFRDVFVRRDGGSVVFYYLQAPGVAIPITNPSDAVKRIRFDTQEQAERFVEQLKKYNPRTEVRIIEAEDGYVVEFPVLTFDIDRDIPLRESYSKMVVRMLSKYWKKSWWEKWGPTAVTLGSIALLLLSALFGFQFVQKSYEHAQQTIQASVATLKESIATLQETVKELSRTNEYLGSLIEARMGGTGAPQGATAPPPG